MEQIKFLERKYNIIIEIEETLSMYIIKSNEINLKEYCMKSKIDWDRIEESIKLLMEIKKYRDSYL